MEVGRGGGGEGGGGGDGTDVNCHNCHGQWTFISDEDPPSKKCI